MRRSFADKPWIKEPTFYHPDVGSETVLQACVRGWGYHVVCCECGAERDRTPEDLLQRFAHAMPMTLRDVLPRFRCSECTSPRLYIWRFQAVDIDTGHRSVASKLERELIILAMADEIVRERAAEG